MKLRARTLGANAALMAASHLASAALSIVALGILTRVLGPASFGEWSVVIAYGTILHAFADWGLYSLLARDIGRPGADVAVLVRAYVWLRARVLLAVFGAGVLAAWLLPVSDDIRLGIAVATVFFVSNSLSQMLVAVFQKHLAMYWVAFAEITAKAIFLLGLVAVARRAGLAAALAALAASGVVQLVILRWAIRFFVEPSGRPPTGWWRAAVRESWPMAVSVGLTLLYFKGDALLLRLFKPPEDVAIYGLGYNILEHLIFFPGMFMGLLLPRLSQRLAAGAGGFQQLLQRVFDLFVSAMVPLVVGLWFVGTDIAFILGGAPFRPAGTVISVLGLAVMLICFGHLFGNAVVVLGQQRRAVSAYLAGLVTMLAVNFALIPRLSYLGTAWATVATEVVVTFCLWRIVASAGGFRLSLRRAGRSIAAAAVMFGILWVGRDAGLAVLVAIGAASYGLAAWLFQAVGAADASLLRLTARTEPFSDG